MTREEFGEALLRFGAKLERWPRTEASAGAGKPLYLGHPEFEGFTVLQEVKADGSANVAAE